MLSELGPFAVAVLLGAMVPGPTTMILIRQTLRDGRGASMWVVAGNSTGLLLWGLAVTFGVSALVTASETAFQAMRIAGAAVLVFLGGQALWHHRRGLRTGPQADGAPQPVPAGGPSAGTGRRNYRLGLITILANPKYALFATSFLPQFVPSHASVLPSLLLLTVVWLVLDACWFTGFVWFVGRLRLVLMRPRVRMRLERATGVVLIGLGVRLALEPL